MRKIIGLALIAMVPLACEKTGENEFEVEKPVIGTTTDTVRTPDIDVTTDTATIKVPDVDVNTEKKNVAVPNVEVKRP
jgi:hypothetical protein